MSIGPMAPPPAAEAVAPPNLRDAPDELTSCGGCQHFREEQGCEQFGGYPVEPDQVCDAFAAMPEGGPEIGGMPPASADPYEMEA